LPKQVVQQRYERLVALVDEITYRENQARVGQTVELLVAVGEGRKDAATGRLSGRARDGRLVHFAASAANGQAGLGTPAIRPGDMVTTVVTYGAPHHLVADEPVLSHRRTRAGDAWEAGHAPKTPGVMLGLPTVGAPAPAAPAVDGCR
jgi:tRNA-2-methylthio-N6-dimethylallyladenosine synthase